MDLLNKDSLPLLQAEVFRDEFANGRLWVPRDVSGPVASLLTVMVQSYAGTELDLFIDTNNGTSTVWDLAAALDDVGWKAVAHVGAEAKSAGLILTCACKGYRICRKDTKFLYHGSPLKAGTEDDERKARWFAAHTTAPYEHWRHMAETGTDFTFGVTEALEWGVIHEVAS